MLMLLVLPPSMRSKAIRCPDSSTTAMHIGTLMPRDAATEPSIRMWASSTDRRLISSTNELLAREGGGRQKLMQRVERVARDRRVGGIGLAGGDADEIGRGLHDCGEAERHPPRREGRELQLQLRRPVAIAGEIGVDDVAREFGGRRR